MKNSINKVVVSGVVTLLNRTRSGEWFGTMTDLGTRLSSLVGKQAREELPGSPSALRVAMNKALRSIRAHGVSVEFGRTTDHSRTRYVRLSA